jgi:ligand-binding sensor domain-containing protein/signal transduction histidine kinase
MSLAKLAGALVVSGCAFCIGLLTDSPCLAQALDPPDLEFGREYRLRRWTSEEGLPQNTIRYLLQTQDGYLWIATHAGLARFDGLYFKIFNKANRPEMESDDCAALVETRDGALWIGTENGLLSWADGRLTRMPGFDKPGSRSIRYLSAAQDNRLWVGTGDGLFCLHEGRVQRFTTADGLQANNIRAVFQDAAGNVWAGPEIQRYLGGLQVRRPGSTRFVNVAGQEPGLLSMVHCFVENERGVWWGNNRGLHRLPGEARADSRASLPAEAGVPGLHRLPGETQADYRKTNGLCGEVIGRLTLGSAQSLLLTVGNRQEVRGRRGVQRLRNGTLQTIALVREGSELDLSYALEDREANVWLGTRGDGLLCLQPRLFRSFTARDGLPNERVNTVAELSPRTMLAGTAAQPIRINADNKISLAQDLAGCPIQVLLKDRHGGTWMAGFIGTTVFLANSVRPGFLFFQDHPDIPRALFERRDTAINCLGVDLDDSLWIGQVPGVAVLNRTSAGSWEAQCLTTREGLAADDVRAILCDHLGNVWLGTEGGGLSRWREGKFSTFKQSDGLCSDSVRALYEDSQRALWIGTDAGLGRFKDGRFASITRAQGLFSDSINQILEDDFGYLWLGCHHGVLRAGLDELNTVADGRAKRIDPVLFGQADGLPSGEISSFQPGACKASDGRLWFPTLKGLAVIDPKEVHLNQVAPPVVIEQVIADGQIVYGEDSQPPPSAPGRLPPGPGGQTQTTRDARLGPPRLTLPPGSARVLEIHYTANSFVEPEKCQFKYQLEGYDPDWRAPDRRSGRVAYYTNLRPGNYTFWVNASDNHGLWNLRGAQFAFYLAPHYYETWPFYAICVAWLLAAGGVIQGWRLRLQRRILKLEHQVALDDERARIAHDIHDDIGSRLSQLAVLGELANRNLGSEAPARPHLAKLRSTTDEVFAALDEIVWTASPKQDSPAGLASYLREFAPEFLSPAGIHCRLDFQNPLPERPLEAQVRHHLFLIVKEALHNVVKHARATEVWLRLAAEGRTLLVGIEDNGQGFEQDAQRPAPSGQRPAPAMPAADRQVAPAPSLGNGLSNMRERCQQIGGALTIHSQPGKGTTISIRVPLK